ncbi:hypothetical protein [Legionella sp.]|uniref:hypothetical protein n=1 Tax=Legionella sp. TaxID=459 RepID=UPI003CA3EA05
MANPEESKTELITHLVGEINQYGYAPDSKLCLSEAGIKALNQGIDSYDANHSLKVSEYKAANNLVEDKEVLITNDPLFFRKQFIEYISQHQPPQFNGDERTRETYPESATLSMHKLLDSKGVELYQLALEEEIHSIEFRHALLMRATTQFKGSKWQERPVIIVSGPSGCGKSYAAQSAVGIAQQFLSTKDNKVTSNNVIAADGGLCRELSQMRKLVIQVANNEGYAGISDLHSKSKILDGLKNKILEAAIASPGVGIVIPETFSKWLQPFHPIKNLMKNIDSLPNTKQIFVRVAGENSSTFQKIVAFMGSRRAWKVDGFTPQKLSLNKQGLTESKAYERKGFNWGTKGSILAEKWFRSNSKDKLSMLITNDLILLKPDPDSLTEKWLTAEAKDIGARLFSERAYKKWAALPTDELKQSLPDYCKTVKLQIKTAAQIDFAIAQKQIKSRIESINKCLEKEFSRTKHNEEKIIYLLNKRDALLDINKISSKDLDILSGINKIKHQIEDCISV